ncbi:hypothetical protein FOBRF1_006919 [Fusarium oxysporum]
MVTPRLKTLAFSGTLLQTAFALGLPECRGFKTAQNGSVLEVTLHNPDSATNLRGVDFQHGMADIVRRLRNDTKTKVIVFKSNIPQFFCAHLDLLIPSIGKKQAANTATRPSLEDLLRDAASFTARSSDPAVPPLIGKALAVTNNLTFGDVELNLGLEFHPSSMWNQICV